MASSSLFRFQKAFWLNGLSLSLYLSLPAPDGPGACSANMQVVRIPVPVYVRPPDDHLYKLYDIFLIISSFPVFLNCSRESREVPEFIVPTLIEKNTNFFG